MISQLQNEGGNFFISPLEFEPWSPETKSQCANNELCLTGHKVCQVTLSQLGINLLFIKNSNVNFSTNLILATWGQFHKMLNSGI